MNDIPTSSISEAQKEKMAAEFRSHVHHQLRLGAERMTRLEEATDHNTEVTNFNTAEIKAMRAETQEMIEIFMAMKGGFKVLEWMGRLAKWGVAIAGGTGLMVKFFWPDSK